jgi:hypothetical protein
VIGKSENIVCVPDCQPQMLVVSLVCGAQLEQTRILSADGSWRVDLSPGKYQITVDAHVIGDDGTSAQLDAAFGLIVDDSRQPAIVDASGENVGSCGDSSNAAAANCPERSKQASSFVQAALSQRTLDCVEDSDCMVVPTNTRCSSGCASMTNREGAAAIAKAIVEGDSVCGPQGECPSQQVPCRDRFAHEVGRGPGVWYRCS